MGRGPKDLEADRRFLKAVETCGLPLDTVLYPFSEAPWILDRKRDLLRARGYTSLVIGREELSPEEQTISGKKYRVIRASLDECKPERINRVVIERYEQAKKNCSGEARKRELLSELQQRFEREGQLRETYAILEREVEDGLRPCDDGELGKTMDDYLTLFRDIAGFLIDLEKEDRKLLKEAGLEKELEKWAPHLVAKTAYQT